MQIPLLQLTGVQAGKRIGLSAGDLDGDGDLDLALNGATGTTPVYWLESNGASPPVFTQHLVLDLAIAPSHKQTSIVDVDADGDLDLINEDRWFENDGAADPVFTEHIRAMGLARKSGRESAKSAPDKRCRVLLP